MNDTVKKRARSLLPPIDLTQLMIEDEVPIPARTGPNGLHKESPWRPVLSALQVGQSIMVPGRSAAQLAGVRGLGKKLSMNLTVRTVDGGARIWRLDDVVDGL